MVGRTPEGRDAGDVPFTESARRLLVDARVESDRLGHEYVGTEHLVLALANDAKTTALLTRLGIGWEQVRASIDSFVRPGRAALPSGAERPYTSRTKRAFAFASEYARSLGHTRVGVEHILVGLLRERVNVGAQALQHNGLTVEHVIGEAQERSTHGSE